MSAPDIAIQIVNYKTKSFLRPLIKSIHKDLYSSGISYKINIIDNASGDNLDDIKENAVDIYYSKDNHGFGAGHNSLARKTTAKYLLMLNPDMLIIEEHTIKRLIDTLENNNASVVGPRLVTPLDRKNLSLEKTHPSYKQQPWDHGEIGKWRFNTTDKLKQVAWVSGAAFLIERDLFIKLNGFDEKFFLYYEEIDLCFRIRKMQQKIIYNPTINMLHYGNAVASMRSVYGFKSFVYLNLKHPTYYLRKQKVKS